MRDKKIESIRTALEKKIIKKEGCWGWKGFLDKDGYGRVTSSYTKEFKVQTSHRASWFLNFGEIPKDKIVRHICNNRECTNPEHLKLGTLSENSQDMMRSKRQAMGTKNGNSKLTEEDVKFIKKMIAKGKPYPLIAELFDVHRDAISNISRGITWKHVE